MARLCYVMLDVRYCMWQEQNGLSRIKKEKIWKSCMKEQKKYNMESEVSSFNEPCSAAFHPVAASLCPFCQGHVWAVRRCSDSFSKPNGDIQGAAAG